MIPSQNYNPHQKDVLVHWACTLMIFGSLIPISLASVIGLVLIISKTDIYIFLPLAKKSGKTRADRGYI
jgi:hypothetical protein